MNAKNSIIFLILVFFSTIPSIGLSAEYSEQQVLGIWKTVKDQKCIDSLIRMFAEEEGQKLAAQELKEQRKYFSAMQIEYAFKAENHGEVRIKMLRYPQMDKMVESKGKIKYRIKHGVLQLFLPGKPNKPQDALQIIDITPKVIRVKEGPCRFELQKIKHFSIN